MVTNVYGHVGLRTGPCSLLIPRMRNMQDIAQFVQMAQTLCYDLARAEKAKDEKKVLHCNRRIGAGEHRQLNPTGVFQ